ncbi:hypothetical protein LX15_004784 [Streptoalloteichus tenebrarius]|uniref:Uncharacterized protein n=1 Tax=Streptoalloteichus tenebrarius (strain ATCC 17920 / DSM 40477 / JCM 4838 / CBS 697.72 / NBRC 16177 / NCIMB 11028 / NRRL B-12390 / A12253. 1 / ISP 5477) TaxID=1933 RepID=A0ABT1HZX2_STRSD|nr:hypothetical protein [Streptoalloteichus tenebrarius]MCP2261064.1 hypothetical protein [Streptoalloteichus tenebrarius]BFF03140.1 hypothetical protein GCM10020241_48150 [Streptoalloteichus tenebrarius]
MTATVPPAAWYVIPTRSARLTESHDVLGPYTQDHAEEVAAQYRADGVLAQAHKSAGRPRWFPVRPAHHVPPGEAQSASDHVFVVSSSRARCLRCGIRTNLLGPWRVMSTWTDSPCRPGRGPGDPITDAAMVYAERLRDTHPAVAELIASVATGHRPTPDRPTTCRACRLPLSACPEREALAAVAEEWRERTEGEQ